MKSTTFLVLVACVLATPLAGQAVDPAAVQAATDALRDRGRSSKAADLLSGARPRLSLGARDALADELVAIAVRFDGATSREARGAANAAIAALVGAAETRHPMPYQGSLERIQRIYEGSPAVGIRSAALLGMTRLPNVRPVIAFMETGI